MRLARPSLAGALFRRLDQLEVGARDPRPRAAGIEGEVALPMPDRLVDAPRARERSRQVEVGVGVVRRELERTPVVFDGVLDGAAVLVEGAEVVRGFAAARVLFERRAVRGVGLVV